MDGNANIMMKVDSRIGDKWRSLDSGNYRRRITYGQTRSAKNPQKDDGYKQKDEGYHKPMATTKLVRRDTNELVLANT